MCIMSTPIPVPVLFWHYPDSVEKMVMNDLVKNNSISKRKFQNEEIGPAVELILDLFEDNGYVSTSMAVDPIDGLTYKRWTVTPFFLSRIQAQRDSEAEQDVIKMALWNQKNQLMAAAQKGVTAMTRAAISSAPMDVNMETESEMHDRIIQPQLDALKKRMQDELAEKKRLERKKLEEEEEDGG
jgi:hypothetical protein